MADSVLNKIFTLSSLAFLCAFCLTPVLTAFLFRNRIGKQIRNDGTTPVYSKLHAGKEGTPTMGGVLVWGTTLVIAVFFWFLQQTFGLAWSKNLNFLTRKETLLPLGAFAGASIVGLIDDWLDARRMGHNGRGLRFRYKIWFYLAVAAIGAWWFYFKLGFSSLHIPFYGNIDFGLWYIPVFIFTVVATSFAVNQTDGLDGLAGGILSLAFFGFALIAYIQGKNDLACLLGVVCGSLLAFLWFNVHPARFFMGDTGSMGMGVLLAVVAFLTNAVLLIPIIGLIFLIEALSTIIQIFSKKFFKKKVFLSSPLHNHLQALGWPETKITMRFWIISAVMSIVGVIFYFIT